jgi:hypothetical protein
MTERARGEVQMKLIIAAPLAAVVLAEAGAGAYFAVANTGSGEEVPAAQLPSTPTLTPTPAPIQDATPTPAPTATPTPTAAPTDWLTYTDATYGYSFDYPPTWYLEPPAKNGGDVILYSYDPAKAKGIGGIPIDKLKVFFWVAEGVDQPLEEWLAEGKTSPGQISPPIVLSHYASTLGGKEGLVEAVENEGVKSISYYIPIGGGRVFVVNAAPADSQVWPEFEPVLDSIQFSP